jgi:ABC-type Fe3+/spermidine/putrescine transport system ATPase subunit
MGQRIAILDRGRIAQVGRPDECYRRPRTRFVARFLGEANFIEGDVARVLEGGGCEVATAVGTLVVKAEGGRKKDECGMRNAEWGIRGKEEGGMRNAECGTRQDETQNQGKEECGMRKAECGIKQSESQSQKESLSESPVHPSSFIPHPSVGQRVCCCFRPESVRMASGNDERGVNSFRARVARATYLGEMLEYELTAGDGSVGLLATVMGGDWAASDGSEVVVAVSPEDIVLL